MIVNNFIKKLYSFIKNRLYVNETIVLYEFESSVVQRSSASIQYANNENLDDILYFQNKQYIDVFRKFLQLGDIGYFAYLNDKCIHRSWVKNNRKLVQMHSALSYRLKENEIFIHYCETAKEARGKNIYPHVLYRIIQDNIDKKILISVNKNNLPSIKGVEKVGFKEKSSHQILIFLGIKLLKEISL